MIEVICREVWRISFIDSIGGSLLAITSIYGIISFGATSVREAGQGRNPAALSDFRCVLFFCVEEDLWLILVFLKIKKAFLLVLFVRIQCIWTSLAWFVRIGIPLISPSRALSIF